MASETKNARVGNVANAAGVAEVTGATSLVPSLEDAPAILTAGEYRRVPVKRELYSDCLTPIEAMRRLRAASHHCFMLESAEADKSWGRYTFLGFNPSMEITCKDGFITIRSNVEGDESVGETVAINSLGVAIDLTHEAGGRDQRDTSIAGPDSVDSASAQTYRVDHPGDAIRQIIADCKSAPVEDFPPFTGGLVGYFSFDYIKYAEPILRGPDFGNEAVLNEGGSTGDFLDMDLMLFDTVICFDAVKQKIVLITGVYSDPLDPANIAAIERSYARALETLAHVEHVLINGWSYPFKPLELETPITPQFSTEQYMDIVRRAKHYIQEGDIFQVVPSNPRRARATGSLFDAYRVLRCENPSPYMFYFTSDDIEIAGASPETLVRLRDGVLHTYPLAGSRPRGATPEEDARLEAEVLSDEKERAEHNMLVDLGRNDLGRISQIGTVEVESYMNVLKFSRIMHIGSIVRGQIAPGRDAIDAIDSVLPAGTLSGAPKIRACQIIHELEGSARGIYGGALGYLDFSGNMDMCIAIRLAYKKGDMVCVQTGAGIVADSDPASEDIECANKARAVVEAIRESEGGLA